MTHELSYICPNGSPYSGYEHAPDCIVWLGLTFFATELREFGWQVHIEPYDLQRPYSFADILRFTGGKIPAAVIASDMSAPPLLVGMETFPCLTGFYAIDSHIHHWHPQYAQGFDFCLVSLKEDIPLFAVGRLGADNVYWSPPYIHERHLVTKQVPSVTDIVFSGTVDPVKTPERHAFFERLHPLLPELSIRNEAHWTVTFKESKIVLNESARLDFNFRIVEAMGSGACLLTPRVGHGLFDLFEDGKDLATYTPGDAQDVVSKARFLLANEAKRKAIAQSGNNTVRANHLSRNRAASLTAILQRFATESTYQRTIEKRLALSETIHNELLRFLYLHHAESVGVKSLSEAYLRAAKRSVRMP